MIWWWMIALSWWLNRHVPPDDYFDYPDHWPAMVHPEENPPTASGIALGRKLFFDPILSRDSTISCGTCHQPALAFTDGRGISIGIDGREGRRSAPTLLNIGFHNHGLFWDGRSPNLEEQSLHPITDPVEMDNQLDTVIRRLMQDAHYSGLFSAAFGTPDITLDRLAKALAQYERSLVSAGSRFDQMVAGEINFSLSELRGWAMFFDASADVPHAECNHCHIDPFFANPQYQNNGLEAGPDAGRAEITGNPYDRGKFKVPTLRNIALTAPYMHDGRFATLEEVLDHYVSGGHPGINVSPNVRPLALDERDKQDLIQFLKTLTDTVFLDKPQPQNALVYEP